MPLRKAVIPAAGFILGTGLLLFLLDILPFIGVTLGTILYWIMVHLLMPVLMVWPRPARLR